jgi:phage shock protein C
MSSATRRIAGIAEYFGIDPTIVRVIYVFLSFGLIGAPVVLYVLLALVIPAAPVIIVDFVRFLTLA